MEFDEKYMYRSLQLAINAKGRVSPNPMVGAVIVYNNRIIGEGYHREYGKPHAEVNAINCVRDKSLLSQSTIYVSLEPCSHYGKTPPCAQLIIDSKIPKVVVATLDPFPKVAGRGVKMLQNAGIDVVVGVLEKEARELNKEFFTYNLQKRPYIYLKWAQTSDGYIDSQRTMDSIVKPLAISNSLTQILVHKLRTEVDGIVVGTNTAVKDNPSLSARLWYGKNPTRIVLDRTGRIPQKYNLFDNSIKTFVFTEKINDKVYTDNLAYILLDFNNTMIDTMLNYLYQSNLQSILIEGGAKLLQYFIDQKAWDEAYIETSNFSIGEGVSSPNISGKILFSSCVEDNCCQVLKNVHNYKIL